MNEKNLALIILLAASGVGSLGSEPLETGGCWVLFPPATSTGGTDADEGGESTDGDQGDSDGDGPCDPLINAGLCGDFPEVWFDGEGDWWNWNDPLTWACGKEDWQQACVNLCTYPYEMQGAECLPTSQVRCSACLASTIDGACLYTLRCDPYHLGVRGYQCYGVPHDGFDVIEPVFDGMAGWDVFHATPVGVMDSWQIPNFPACEDFGEVECLLPDEVEGGCGHQSDPDDPVPWPHLHPDPPPWPPQTCEWPCT